jgi:hypothetical protein
LTTKRYYIFYTWRYRRVDKTPRLEFSEIRLESIVDGIENFGTTLPMIHREQVAREDGENPGPPVDPCGSPEKKEIERCGLRF